MDVEKIKSELRAKGEEDRLQEAWEKKRLQARKTELLNFKMQFRHFFRDIHHFACPKDNEPLVASFESIEILLAENVERNEKEKGYNIYFTLTSYDKSVHSIFAEGVAYKLGTNGADDVRLKESELSVGSLKFREDVIKGRIIYKYQYRIEGNEKEFVDLRGLIEFI